MMLCAVIIGIVCCVVFLVLPEFLLWGPQLGKWYSWKD